MKKLLFSSILLGFLIVGNSCHSSLSSTGGHASDSNSITKDVNAQEFKKLIDEGKGVLIDIRTPQEFTQGYIKGAININWAKREFQNKMNELDKNKSYLIYCRSGNRTYKAMMAMKGMGFKEIYNLEKGIISWQAAGYEIVK